jgi:biopolymer transport protein ExbB/TolQ
MNSLIVATGVVEVLVMITLAALSVWSIATILDRFKFFKNKNAAFFAGQLIEQVASYKKADDVTREMARNLYFRKLKPEVEKGFTLLASLGANAPFIGLFGTVLGIIRAFAYLGEQSGSTAVMSGVSQALYATALGLLVAIPAVVAFNYFSRRAKDLYLEIENIKDEHVLSRQRNG